MKKSLFLISFALIQTANANRDVERLNVVFSPDGKTVQVKTVEYADVSADVSLNIVSPSPQNRSRLKQVWSGSLISKILSENSVPFNAKDIISIAANDQYTSQIFGSDILNHKVIVATLLDGKKLDWIAGGPQTVFPIADKKLHAEYKSHLWWPWYTSAILVGTLPPTLQTVFGNQLASISLDKCPNQTEGTILYPHGMRRTQAPKNPIEKIRYCTVKNLFGDKKISSLLLHSYTGVTVEVTKSFEKYKFITGWNEKGISPSFGGPVQACFGENTNECLFLLSKIEVR